MAGGFVKYNAHTCEIFVTVIFFSRRMKLLTQRSPCRHFSTASTRLSTDVHDIPATQHLNDFTRVSARCTLVATVDNQDNVVEALPFFLFARCPIFPSTSLA